MTPDITPDVTPLTEEIDEHVIYWRHTGAEALECSLAHARRPEMRGVKPLYYLEIVGFRGSLLNVPLQVVEEAFQRWDRSQGGPAEAGIELDWDFPYCYIRFIPREQCLAIIRFRRGKVWAKTHGHPITCLCSGCSGLISELAQNGEPGGGR